MVTWACVPERLIQDHRWQCEGWDLNPETLGYDYDAVIRRRRATFYVQRSIKTACVCLCQGVNDDRQHERLVLREPAPPTTKTPHAGDKSRIVVQQHHRLDDVSQHHHCWTQHGWERPPAYDALVLQFQNYRCYINRDCCTDLNGRLIWNKSWILNHLKILELFMKMRRGPRKVWLESQSNVWWKQIKSWRQPL